VCIVFLALQEQTAPVFLDSLACTISQGWALAVLDKLIIEEIPIQPDLEENIRSLLCDLEATLGVMGYSSIQEFQGKREKVVRREV